ncbi:tRNA(Ile2) 2-agmatinylcytidine synthetase TiaS (tRNA(Ile2)-agm2C synthetase) like [Melia azedarach]|uniref:tRNA(Ile2) 2-agmatinylcytidine synthetase TiaS (tRNA(Ile2)-agm2C synthetase) like n=1 Tax=Melia azedarach TaxID=155640 RepID=A0ACC1XPY7_MELAZ|nr:tRNA(Ile2) 2-agmatinylcytidine synthetase TiaS (tRNA(Ile2)-agm2C synthetase) like [Melia azedarach]
MDIKQPSSPPSTSDSQNSATQPIQPKCEVDDAPANNGVFDVFDQKPETKPDSIPQHFQVLKSEDYIEKYQKYEANYTRRLMAKYFSKNNIYGGNIFDEKITIDGETIMSSRWPCTRSFADPVQGFEDQNISGSTSTAETPNNISNGKHTPKKNS